MLAGESGSAHGSSPPHAMVSPPSELSIHLEETGTCLLFVRPSTCAVAGSEEHKQICQRNKVYASLKAARQSVPGKFKIGHSQTLNPQQKIQAVATDSQEPVSQGVGASPANIYDALATKTRSL